MVRTAPFFGLAVGMSALTILEQRGHVLRAGATSWQLGPAERLVVAGKAIGFYAARVLWPARLTFVYPRWAVDASHLWSWAPAVALVAVAVALWRYRSRGWGRAAVFGAGFFVVALLPVLGFFNVYYFRFSYVADHFQYLACLGLISLAASTGAAICERAGPRGRDWGVVAAAVVLLILGVSTWRQARIYQDPETLWRDTLTKNPQCWMAHNNLATTLKSLGRVQEAVEHWEQCLRIKPDYAEAHCNLGYTWQQMGKIEEAIAQYEQALRSKPDFAEAHNNLGTVLLQEGRVSEALGQYEQALRSNPDYAEAHNNLGTVLLQEGKVNSALGQYEQALRSKPDYAEAHYNLGIALVRLGRVQEAVGHWEQALRIKPDYAEVQYSLGTTLQQAGRVTEAVGHYEQALRSNPDYAEAHYNLGVALGQTGRIREAMEHWQQALRIKPDYRRGALRPGDGLGASGPGAGSPRTLRTGATDQTGFHASTECARATASPPISRVRRSRVFETRPCRAQVANAPQTCWWRNSRLLKFKRGSGWWIRPRRARGSSSFLIATKSRFPEDDFRQLYVTGTRQPRKD